MTLAVEPPNGVVGANFWSAGIPASDLGIDQKTASYGERAEHYWDAGFREGGFDYQSLLAHGDLAQPIDQRASFWIAQDSRTNQFLIDSETSPSPHLHAINSQLNSILPKSQIVSVVELKT